MTTSFGLGARVSGLICITASLMKSIQNTPFIICIEVSCVHTISDCVNLEESPDSFNKILSTKHFTSLLVGLPDRSYRMISWYERLFWHYNIYSWAGYAVYLHKYFKVRLSACRKSFLRLRIGPFKQAYLAHQQNSKVCRMTRPTSGDACMQR